RTARGSARGCAHESRRLGRPGACHVQSQGIHLHPLIRWADDGKMPEMKHQFQPGSSGCPGRLSAPWSRREMLQASANGFGLLALSGLLADPAHGAASVPDLGLPHFTPRAKNVIFCFMDGGVSHVDSFDPKPKLDELDNQPFTESKNPTANG